MGVQVTFDYTVWSTRYSEFAANVTEAQAQLFFNEACLYHPNDGRGPINDPGVQLMLLNMVTAHIAKLAVPGPGGFLNSPPGRISSTSGGGVSVSSESEMPGTADWYKTTHYGRAYWGAMAPSRTARYVPGPQRQFDAFIPWR